MSSFVDMAREKVSGKQTETKSETQTEKSQEQTGQQQQQRSETAGLGDREVAEETYVSPDWKRLMDERKKTG